jgi:pyrroline-5-carboxylate reductase
VTPADRKRAVSLMSALGATEWVKQEKLIDSVVAVSGSGPAYLFLFAEALTEAGVAEGLPRAQAEKFARATVAGAGALLAADKSPASSLREAVTSPGGTTAAALSVFLENDALLNLVKRAARAAVRRSQELG